MRREGADRVAFLLLICVAVNVCLTACVNGIPPPDGWEPVKVKPCHVVVVQDESRVCLTRWEFNEWRRANGL